MSKKKLQFEGHELEANSSDRLAFDGNEVIDDRRTASEMVDGIIEIATQAETDAGTDDSKAVTPAKLSAYPSFNQATESTAGIAELATQAETDAGTDDLRIVTPLKLHSKPGRVKAWVKFDGTGTLSVIDSYNVTSVVDNGTGDYIIYLNNDVGADACAQISGKLTDGNLPEDNDMSIRQAATDVFRARTSVGGTAIDYEVVYVIIVE